jgi:flagellar basal body-associated protein FliL
MASPAAACRAAGPRRGFAAAVLVALAPWAGCYDGAVLLEMRRDERDAVALEEVDLGKFVVALPNVIDQPAGLSIEYHAFGYVSHNAHAAVAAALAEHRPELRSRMLVSVRSLPYREFEEPRLSSLRQRVAEVVNSVLKDQRVENVGFYAFKLTAK